MARASTKYAIFLGAGASAAEGAALQSNLFRDYFMLLKKRARSSPRPHEKKLSEFFLKMFDIDVRRGKLGNINFPTFEEALGVLDLADMKNESFKDFSITNFADGGSIKILRIYLVFLMADIIHDGLRRSNRLHHTLIKKLNSGNSIKDTVFLTTNYDILCDNALLDLYPERKVDYGVDLANYDDGTFYRPDLDAVKFYKLHGSLNWIYCPTCNNLRITPYQKGVYNLMVDPAISRCKVCKTVYAPIIVPPTFYKDMSKVFLNQVWSQTEKELLKVDHLIICGYSFPDADIHIKYLMKRIQKNRTKTKPLKITVINSYPGKKATIKDEERSRYERFLGKDVDYTDFSFEQFANNPFMIMR